MNAPILAGTLVLDLSRVLAGPWTTQILADLGATVIKVEHPNGGDDTRSFGPPFLEMADGDDHLSAYYISANRGKHSICIDISQPKGVELVSNLARKADIFVENFKFGDLTKKGLGYEKLGEINPALIYCSITGFGQTGPYRERPGYDMVAQAMAGLMSITGESDSVGGRPQKVGVAVADVMTGLYSSIAILAALRERDTSGKGQHIDMALLDVVTAALANQASNYLVSGDVPERLGNDHPNIVPYQVFDVADGYMIVAVANDRQFKKFTSVVNAPDIALDPRYQTNADRVHNRDTLVPTLSVIMKGRTLDDWLGTFDGSGVPVSPINTIDRVFNDPQIQSRAIRQEADGVPMVANPIRFSRSPMAEVVRPPMLGEHDNRLIDLLGLTSEELDELRKQKIIGKRE
ncbi:MAG: crotonobetainyl-CoA:carnitine CoA-transferase CaiB-like acyl-CoA transferase [Candidatus Azotimanducaceae bacterium]